MTFSMIKIRDMDYCTQHDGIPSRHDWICNQSMWRLDPPSFQHSMFTLMILQNNVILLCTE